MFGMGIGELVVIGVIIALLFGGKKIPELMKGLGSGIREFKQAANPDQQDASSNAPRNDAK